jgi:hypothetical protein
MKELGKIFKTIDIFGHSVSLNFNKKGPTHSTLIGGFSSLMIAGLLAYLSIINLRLMF